MFPCPRQQNLHPPPRPLLHLLLNLPLTPIKQKLIVIVGPNASGKSAFAIQLAKKFRGEIISADSRQVYRGLDIGSGKITKKEMGGIPHHLLGVANSKRRFTVVQFRNKARKAILEIASRYHLPFLVGGSGFYIQAVVDNITIPEVPPNTTLRKKLEKKTKEELLDMLTRLDPDRAKTIDRKNKRRLIRALEIIYATGGTVPPIKQTESPYDVLMLGVAYNKETLARRIAVRLKKRLGKGMIGEVKRLQDEGVSWRRLEELGLEYRWIARYLQGKITEKEMKERLQKDIENFAKRQMTWFKRDKRIYWISARGEAEKLILEFLAM